MNKFFILTLLAAMLFPAQVKAAKADSLRTVEQKRLMNARSAADSIPILYNILDLTDMNKQPEVTGQLFATAGRAGNVDVQLDAARLGTVGLKVPEDLDRLIAAVKKLPPSLERDETILFLRMKQLPLSVRFADEHKREEDITRLLSTYDENGTPEEKLFDLFSAVEYMRHDLNGEMLNEAIDALVKMTRTGDFKLYTIRNLIYTEAANVYSDAGRNKEAIEADRQLLKIIDELKERYRKENRKYRDYDTYEYISLRRMMRNYPGLSRDSVDAIHREVTKLAERSPQVAADMKANPRYYAYYYAAIGDWAKALPAAKTVLDTKKLPDTERRVLLSILQKAAEATGDHATLVAALSASKFLLEKIAATNAAEKYKELHIRYAVNTYKQRAMELELEKREQEIASTRTLMTFVIAGWAIMAIILVCFLFYWVRYRRNLTGLNSLSQYLITERDILRDSAYLDYEPEEVVEDSPRRSSSLSRNNPRDSRIIAENIINDVMYIASIGKSEHRNQIATFRLSALVKEATDKVRPFIRPGVKFTVEETPDVILHTDRDCATHVLYHILHNAALHTSEGEIALRTVADEEAGTVKFVLTDTGIPLQSGQEEMLFEHFVEIDRLAKLRAPGLFLCRIAAFLLKSSLKSVSGYKNGCKFTFIMNIDIDS